MSDERLQPPRECLWCLEDAGHEVDWTSDEGEPCPMHARDIERLKQETRSTWPHLLAAVAWLIALVFCVSSSAGNGACDAGEGLSWDPVPDATHYVVFASVDFGPFVAIADLPPHFPPWPDPDSPLEPRTWTPPELNLPDDLPAGSLVTLRVGHDGTPASDPGPMPDACSWNPPCSMGFGGSDPREDVRACAGIQSSPAFDESAWPVEFDGWSWE